MKYKVYTKFHNSSDWSLSYIHAHGEKEYFTDINDAFRYMEKKQLEWPDYDYDVRVSE